MRGWLHTAYKGGHWVNEIEGGGVVSRHWTKEEAVEAGRETARAQRTEHLIHRIDGGIAERHNYGSNPFPPVG
jgi:Uncharacterized protein conserved in bacteria (DUF2188)